MTDPVDTDALRDAAWEKYAALIGSYPHSIDRDTFEQGWDAAADEIDRLRAAIESAPHASGCQFSLLPEDKPRHCTCWKADT